MTVSVFDETCAVYSRHKLNESHSKAAIRHKKSAEISLRALVGWKGW